VLYLKDLVSKLLEGVDFEFKNPWRASSRALTVVVPIVAKRAGSREYVTLEEVTDKVKITDTGSISGAKIEGDVDKPTFIRGGTMLKGATQERASQYGIVVVPVRAEQIPVHCIHASRGIHAGAGFSIAGVAPAQVYAAMAQHRSQSATWNAVADFNARATHMAEHLIHPEDRHFPSDDLVKVQETLQAARKDLQEILKGLPSYIDQVGAIIIDPDGVLSLETYDHPDSWKALSQAIIQSVSDALAKEDKLGIFKPDMQAIIPVILSFLRQMQTAAEEEVFNQNSARTVLLNAESFVGEYASLNGKTIHLLIARKEKELARGPPSRGVWYGPLEPLDHSRSEYRYETTVLTANVSPPPRRRDKWAVVLDCLDQPKTWSNLTHDIDLSKATLSTRLKDLQSIGAVEKQTHSNGKVRYARSAYGEYLVNQSEQ